MHTFVEASWQPYGIYIVILILLIIKLKQIDINFPKAS